MYRIKEEFTIKVNKTAASEIIGISRPYLTDILNGKQKCSKIVAYCITKFINPEWEIEELFNREED